MGTEYSVYVEARIKGEWHSINAHHYKYHKDSNEKTLVLVPAYWNGSRSMFSRAYSKFREEGHFIAFNQLSPEVQALYPSRQSGEDYDYYDKETFPVITFDTLKSLAAGEYYEHSGFVLKSDVFNYEKEYEDIYEWLSADEYRELFEEEKKLYQAYSWSNRDGWFIIMKEIYESVRHLVDAFEDVNYAFSEALEIRIVCIAS